MCVLMAAVCGAAERPAEIVQKNGLPTIQINKAAKDFKVGKMVPGEAYTTFFAKTNAAGEVTEISSVPATRTVGDIFSSRVGMRYVSGDGEVLGGSPRGEQPSAARRPKTAETAPRGAAETFVARRKRGNFAGDSRGGGVAAAQGVGAAEVCRFGGEDDGGARRIFDFGRTRRCQGGP